MSTHNYTFFFDKEMPWKKKHRKEDKAKREESPKRDTKTNQKERK